MSESVGNHILDLISNPFLSQLQTEAIGAAVGTYFGISVLLAIFFSFLRPRHRIVYAPKTKTADAQHAPPSIGNGFLEWVGVVSKAKEKTLVDKLGMDAVVFLRFTRMLRNMFIILAVIGVAIMIPVNVTQSKSANAAATGFVVMTPLNVYGNGLWAQVIVAWVNNIVVAYFLWHNYRRIHKLRRDYLESPEYQHSLHARTLLIRDIPAKFRSEEGLLEIADKSNPTGITPRAVIGRNVRVLPDLIEEHEENVKELERVLAKYLKYPEKPLGSRPLMKAPKKYKGPRNGGQVDAIDYLTENIRQLEIEIHDIRHRVGMREPMPYGFATWDEIPHAHAVAYASRNKHPNGTKIALAPRPNDILWNNLLLSKSKRRGRRFINGIWAAALTVVWLPLNAAIAVFLSNLGNLGSVWPAFQTVLYRHPTLWAIVQAIVPPTITSLVYLVLPIIFRRLQNKAGDYTKTARERHVLRNLYIFFVLNNLILFSIFSSVWQYISAVVKAGEAGSNIWQTMVNLNIFAYISNSLCQISPFWVIWLLQRNLGATIDLAQLWTLFYVWFCRTFLSPTPREKIEWTAPPRFDYASYYNYFLFYSTVALCFSTLQPVILLVVALYFTLDVILKKYLLMYVFVTKTESGGLFWQVLFNRLIFACMLSDVVIAAVVKTRGTWTMVIAVAPLLVLMLGLKFYCRSQFDSEIKYYTKKALQDEERAVNVTGKRRADKISTKFGHPALYKPLITPMVHAKAKEVLGNVYRGRLHSDATDAVAEFSDIAMQPMMQTGKPQQDAPFEIVPEAQQDFAYYKGRSDFREEGGDMYGRPDDTLTERSQTPMSYLGKDTFSPYTSRPGSPSNSPPSYSIPRKEVDTKNVPVSILAGRHTPDAVTRLEAEAAHMSGRHSLEHEHRDGDDRLNLLNDVGGIHEPTGEFMGFDRSRNQTPGIDGPASTTYEYFHQQK